MPTLDTPHIGSDMGLLSIASVDVTCAFENASFEVAPNDIDASSACQEGQMMQTVGLQGTLSGRFFGPSSNGYRTNYLDFSAISVGGTDLRAQLYEMQFRGTFERQDLPAATMGLATGILRRNFSGSLQLLFDDTQTAQTLFVAAASMNPADKLADLIMTLSGNTIKLPIKLGRATVPIQRGDFVRSTIEFSGQAPARGVAYPTLPTALPTTPGILDLALLSPKGRFAYDFISKDLLGIRSNGFVRFGDFGFNYTTRGLTYFDYQFLTDGNFTTVLRAGS